MPGDGPKPTPILVKRKLDRIRARTIELRDEVAARAAGERPTDPVLLNRRTTLKSKTTALQAARDPYARRFIRSLADGAEAEGIDMFTSFAAAVTGAPGAAEAAADPRVLISMPSGLTSDMRIAVCRAFGGVRDDLIFAGYYPPPGAPVARLLYGYAVDHDPCPGERFIPWLISRMEQGGPARAELVDFMKGLRLPTDKEQAHLADALGITGREFSCQLEELR